MPPYPDSEFLSVPLDVGVSGIGNDAAVAAVIYWPDHAKVVDCIAAFIVIYVVNRSCRILAKHEEPCESVSGILAALDLDLDVPVLACDGSGTVAYGYAHSRLHFPVKTVLLQCCNPEGQGHFRGFVSCKYFTAVRIRRASTGAISGRLVSPCSCWRWWRPGTTRPESFLRKWSQTCRANHPLRPA